MHNSVNKIFKKAFKSLDALHLTKKQYSERTPIKLGLSQDDFTKVSYTTEKRQNELISNNILTSKNYTKEQRKKYFYHTSLNKILAKFYYNFEMCFNESNEVRKIVLELEKDLFDFRKIKLVCLTGKDITTIYSQTNERLRSMSCMQGKFKGYFRIFELLPQANLYALIFNGECYARCLVWKQNNRMFIDRIYTYAHNNPISLHIYERFIEQIYKANKSKLDSTTIRAFNIHQTNLKGFSSPNIGDLIATQSFDDVVNFPYMDTFMYMDKSRGALSTCNDEDFNLHLNQTNGGFEEVFTECPCCGRQMDEEEQCYDDHNDEYICESCAVWSDVDECYYNGEECTYIDGNVNSWVHDNDIRN